MPKHSESSGSGGQGSGKGFTNTLRQIGKRANKGQTQRENIPPLPDPRTPSEISYAESINFAGPSYGVSGPRSASTIAVHRVDRRTLRPSSSMCTVMPDEEPDSVNPEFTMAFAFLEPGQRFIVSQEPEHSVRSENRLTTTLNQRDQLAEQERGGEEINIANFQFPQRIPHPPATTRSHQGSYPMDFRQHNFQGFDGSNTGTPMGCQTRQSSNVPVPASQVIRRIHNNSSRYPIVEMRVGDQTITIITTGNAPTLTSHAPQADISRDDAMLRTEPLAPSQGVLRYTSPARKIGKTRVPFKTRISRFFQGSSKGSSSSKKRRGRRSPVYELGTTSSRDGDSYDANPSTPKPPGPVLRNNGGMTFEGSNLSGGLAQNIDREEYEDPFRTPCPQRGISESTGNLLYPSQRIPPLERSPRPTGRIFRREDFPDDIAQELFSDSSSEEADGSVTPINQHIAEQRQQTYEQMTGERQNIHRSVLRGTTEPPQTPLSARPRPQHGHRRSPAQTSAAAFGLPEAPRPRLPTPRQSPANFTNIDEVIGAAPSGRVRFTQQERSNDPFQTPEGHSPIEIPVDRGFSVPHRKTSRLSLGAVRSRTPLPPVPEFSNANQQSLNQTGVLSAAAMSDDEQDDDLLEMSFKNHKKYLEGIRKRADDERRD